MKINEVEAAVGVTKKNIRFYEEEGLLRPRRDAGNGYRDYAAEDVARLQRIKLLRKLNVPLAEIREMLNGNVSLADGMRRHAVELEAQQKSLAAAMEFCKQLGAKSGDLDDLDASDALESLENRERQGVRFVNVQKVDRKTMRYQGAVLGAALFILLMLFLLGVVIWGMATDPGGLPGPLAALFIGLPSASIICVIVVLVQRFQEIDKGEEDAYRNY